MESRETVEKDHPVYWIRRAKNPNSHWAKLTKLYKESDGTNTIGHKSSKEADHNRQIPPSAPTTTTVPLAPHQRCIGQPCQATSNMCSMWGRKGRTRSRVPLL